jgi:hypothetical protein
MEVESLRFTATGVVKRGQAALILDTSLLETLSQNKSMTLREVTRAVIDRVENVSGCPVVRIPLNSATDSGRNRPAIPEQSGRA